jgi:hypothetical protein
MRRLGALLVAITAAATAAVVAAPAGAGAQQSEQPDACTIVPETDLEAAAGYPLEAGEPVVSSAAASGCGFQATTPSDGPDIGILVTTTATGNAKKMFSVKSLERNFGKSTKVPDLGRRANYAFKKGKVPQAALVVVDGSDGVTVTLRGATTKREALTESEAIATLALAALTAPASTTTTPVGG